MKILKSALNTLLALAVCGLPAIASAQTTFVSRHPGSITEIHASNAGGSASMAATAVMGAQGFSAAAIPPDFEAFMTSGCTAKTKTLAAPPIGTGTLPLSVWPATCNPDGMSLFLNQFSPPNPVGQPAVHWIAIKSTSQPIILNEIIRGLRDFGSPGNVPIYGQADHWVTVTQVTIDAFGNISNVRAFDGGKVGGADSGTNSYLTGLVSWSGTSFRNIFFLVVTAINPSCDNVVPGGCGAPPVSDPFANNYVLMYEPPGAEVNTSASPVSFNDAPGIVSKGTMTAMIAQSRVMDALVGANINKDDEMWNGIRAGSPGSAVQVSAVWPSGAPWSYFLVPLISAKNAHTAIGFVHLNVEDGSFEGVNLLATPVAYNPVQLGRAQELARRTLNGGESLSGGALTWNPRTQVAFAKSPNEPYYEFGIVGGKGGTVRVRFNDGTAIRGQ